MLSKRVSLIGVNSTKPGSISMAKVPKVAEHKMTMNSIHPTIKTSSKSALRSYHSQKSDYNNAKIFPVAHGNFGESSVNWTPLAIGIGALAIGTAAYMSQDDKQENQNNNNFFNSTFVAHAASTSAPSESLAQNTVVTGNLTNGGFLVIHLNKNVDLAKVGSAAAKIAQIAKDVGEGDQLYAGIGFGTQLWEQIAKEHKISPPEGILHFKEKKGKLGSMPASGGDIFVHVKAKNISQCYEVIHQFISSLPAGSVASVDDEYGWHFQDGRDLSGFIDGTENVADAVKRREYGLLPSGGSYAIHQRWIHDIKNFEKLPVEEQEKIVGRSKPDSARLSALPKDSHVARSRDDKDNQIPIIRQSMPFGPAKGPRGLLFIAYANSPARFDVLLDRMTGKGGSDDRIMAFSKCVAVCILYRFLHFENQ